MNEDTLIKFSEYVGNDKDIINSIVMSVIGNPKDVNKLIELRALKTFDFLYGIEDYNRDRVNTDVSILAELTHNGFNFNELNVDLSNRLWCHEKHVNFSKLVNYYVKGFNKAEIFHKDTNVTNPFDSNEIISAQEVLEILDANNDFINYSSEAKGSINNVKGYSSLFLMSIISSLLCVGILITGLFMVG